MKHDPGALRPDMYRERQMTHGMQADREARGGGSDGVAMVRSDSNEGLA